MLDGSLARSASEGENPPNPSGPRRRGARWEDVLGSPHRAVPAFMGTAQALCRRSEVVNGELVAIHPPIPEIPTSGYRRMARPWRGGLWPTTIR